MSSAGVAAGSEESAPIPRLTAEEIRADYLRIAACSYSANPLTVPAAGVTLQIDTARWVLESGRIWLQEPTADGRVSGLVFEGSGRFGMEVPDPVELRQLRRFASRPSLGSIATDFSALVLHTAGGDALSGLEAPAGGYATHALARKRIEHAGKIRSYDVGARLVVALHLSAGRYLRADMNTADLDWLTFTFDGLRREEIELEKYQTGGQFLESWLSLDRDADRAPDGRPGRKARPLADIGHVAVRAEVIKTGKLPDWVAGEFEVDVEVETLAEEVRALPFYLHPWARVHDVSDSSDRTLTFLRERGEERKTLAGRGFDSILVVVLPEVARRGETRTLTFRYSPHMPRYAAGHSWYPTLETGEFGLDDRYPASLEITTRKEYEIRAMGTLEGERIQGGRKTAVWNVTRPARMITFAFSRRTMERSMKFEGLPEVISFGEEAGSDTEDAFHDIAADAVNSLNFFQKMFASSLETERLYATLIDGFHGQAFDGFLHLTNLTAAGDHPGSTELFRAHEVAHEWWGHLVGSAGYRDAWLAEGFAQYSAMIFVQASLEKGPELFAEILEASNNELTGSLKQAFSKFARPGLAIQNRSDQDRIGPIGHGWRANTNQAPNAYWSLVYVKGAYVLHMLRVVLRQITGSDEAFFATLREFIDTYKHGSASTADFQTILVRHAPADWDWFFDQWVYGTDIPTYDWSYETSRSPDQAGKYVVSLTVRQSDVGEGFRMPVPVRFELPGKRVGQVLVLVDQPEKTFQIPLPERPTRVSFNPDYSILARMKKR